MNDIHVNIQVLFVFCSLIYLDSAGFFVALWNNFNALPCSASVAFFIPFTSIDMSFSLALKFFIACLRALMSSTILEYSFSLEISFSYLLNKLYSITYHNVSLRDKL